ncbi:MAG TPA: NUDIX hydrolase [Nitrososphaeraceae archaeon]|jgi:ADP-ribose pyrophosphatase|nr:NUDIX hydrolase [Nitrososphaeraceae archaeon]
MDHNTKISSSKLYSGKISIRLDKYYLGNKIIKKEIVEHSDSVGIVALDDKENIILVEQFRIAARNSLLEIPAGKIENCETPKVAALREMNEEIGYTGNLSPLFQSYLAPGYDTEKMHFFLATELKISKKRLPQDDDEEIRIRRMTLSSAFKKCISGKIIDCKTIAAVMMIMNRKNELIMRNK